MSNKQTIKNLINENLIRYGKNVYLLGTALYGPTNEPILIDSLPMLYNIFGNEGTLIEAYETIINIYNNIKIYCCKISGNHSVLELNMNVNNDRVYSNAITFKSIYSNEMYNNIAVSVLKDSIIFQLPSEMDNKVIEYKYSDYNNIQSFIDEINNDTLENKNCILASYSVDENTSLIGAFDTVNSNKLYFYGGENGLYDSKNKMYDNLQKTLSLLEGNNVDVIIPLDMYMDDIDLNNNNSYGVSEYGKNYYENTKDRLTNDSVVKSFYDLILMYCANQLNFGITTLGIIGFDEIHDDLDSIREIININKYNEQLESFRGLVSISYGKLYYSFKEINSSIIYGLLIAKTNINVSPINLSINDKLILKEEFENDMLKELHNIGLVTFRYSPLKNTVVNTNDITSANPDSELLYIHNLRQVQFAISCIYDIYTLYVGDAIESLLFDDKLKKALNYALGILIDNKVLIEYFIVINKVSNDTISIQVNMKNKYMVEFVTSSTIFKSKVVNYD